MAPEWRAIRYGVSDTLIRRIAKGIAWAHLGKEHPDA